MTRTTGCTRVLHCLEQLEKDLSSIFKSVLLSKNFKIAFMNHRRPIKSVLLEDTIFVYCYFPT
jgi:hypothetical protein